jgi:Uma2 family endonuclease
VPASEIHPSPIFPKAGPARVRPFLLGKAVFPRHPADERCLQDRAFLLAYGVTALLQPAPVSIENYLEGEELSDVKHEYIGGAVHAMAGETNNHAAIAANAIGVWVAALRGKPCRPFTGDAKVRIELADQTRFYYPDAQVVCRPNPGNNRFQENPTVVLEVLGESTRRIDLGEKRDAYLAIPSLKVLLIAESDRPYVSVHRRRPQGGFEVEEYPSVGAVIGLPEIEAELPLAELYEGIDFSAAPHRDS